MLIACVALVGCSSLRISDAGRRTPSDWLTEGGTNARANSVDLHVALPLEEQWVYNAGGGFGPGGPLIVGSYVYVHTRKGEIHAIRDESGKKEGIESFGESVNGTPAMRGRIIFVPAAWGSRHGMIAHDLNTGRRLWRIECPPVDEGVLLLDDMVFFSDAESTLHAVDSETGSVIWQTQFNPARAITTTPVLANESTLILADDKGGVHALSAREGGVLWTRELGEAVYATPAASRDILILGTARGSVHALRIDDGATTWLYRLADTTTKMASPAIGRDRVVIGASDGMVRTLTLSDGTLEWTWHGDGAITASPLLAGDQVFFGTMRKSVHALDLLSGHELWAADVEGRVKSAPSIREGSVYFLSEPRHVYKFSPKEDSVASRE